LDDARHFHKIALSLGQTNKYVLNIIGQNIKNIQQAKNITFHRLNGLKSNYFKRLISPFIYLRKTWQIKPDLQIICTWELLPVAVIVKLFRGGKLIYDIQENYINNIRFLGNELWIIKQIKTLVISVYHKLSWSSIDRFFLAEQSYLSEFTLHQSKYIILENKSLRINRKRSTSEKINFIFTGTIGAPQGIWDVLEWAENAGKLRQNVQLTIIGHCPSKATFKALQTKAGGKDYVNLQVQTEPIPYEIILDSISKADVGIIAYPPNQANQDKFPSKLYEYLAAQLPVFLLHPNPKWEAILDQYQAGISSRSYPDFQSQLDLFKTKIFYPNSSNRPELHWQSNEVILLKCIEELLIS